MVPSTVVLVDDHPLFRAGLAKLLSQSPDPTVLVEAPDLVSARTMIGAVSPSLVVTDVMLPDGDGIAAVPELRRLCSTARFLVLTVHKPEAHLARAFAAGVTGFALKTQSPGEILAAIECVSRGERYLPPSEARAGTPALEEPALEMPEMPEPLARLSRRDREIFELVIRGYTNAATARVLSISPKTVATHRARINQRLGVHSTGEVIRLAARHGLIGKA